MLLNASPVFGAYLRNSITIVSRFPVQFQCNFSARAAALVYGVFTEYLRGYYGVKSGFNRGYFGAIQRIYYGIIARFRPWSSAPAKEKPYPCLPPPRRHVFPTFYEAFTRLWALSPWAILRPVYGAFTERLPCFPRQGLRCFYGAFRLHIARPFSLQALPPYGVYASRPGAFLWRLTLSENRAGT